LSKASLWAENFPDFSFFFVWAGKKLKFFLPPVGNLPDFVPFGTECGTHKLTDFKGYKGKLR
jgi:hypothetical protein